ncbi:histidine kinase-like ATPase [Coprinopsis sp. MPI-PUGE-AT-0042]|nr:histidine kinase-like ATPase [Coprinopsis sp. MPI-PUGE-AT-0042]
MDTLSLPTQAKLRSTQILTSLPQIVSELLQNALDAGAKNVDIGLDAQEWMCWVKDDGCGIARDALSGMAQREDSGRYSTSKDYAANAMNSQSTFGFRGEALASAAELSCLEVVSRTANSRDCWSVILKGGKRLYEGLAVRWWRESPGTVVCVRDAFYNLPVRRLSHPSPAKTWDLVRHELEVYALVFPEVSFTLEDIHGASEGTVAKSRTVKILRTMSVVESFRRLYGQAFTEHLEEVDVSSGPLRVWGFISLCGSYSKVGALSSKLPLPD